MPNMPKRQGDAVLCKDGTVKVAGERVGFWWIDGNNLYQFDTIRPADGSWSAGKVTQIMRHLLKTEIPEYLERNN